MKYHVTITEINYGGVDVEAQMKQKHRKKRGRNTITAMFSGRTARFPILMLKPPTDSRKTGVKRDERGQARYLE
ncbi:MAG: hypothetical protein ACLT1K_10760 [[Clostridium] leptum]